MLGRRVLGLQQAAVMSPASRAEAAAPASLGGQIYTWGYCTHGQLGIKEQILGMREYIEKPTRAGTSSQLRDVELRTAACGHFHSLVVDVSGNVFSFNEALHHSDMSASALIPRSVMQNLQFIGL